MLKPVPADLVRVLDKNGVPVRMITKEESKKLWKLGLATCHDDKNGVPYMKLY